jgi:hypothetical protein
MLFIVRRFLHTVAAFVQIGAAILGIGIIGVRSVNEVLFLLYYWLLAFGIGFGWIAWYFG